MGALVHIITSMELGGAQKICLSTVQHFAAQGRPTFLIYGEDGPLTPLAREYMGAKLIRVPALQRAISIPRDIQCALQLQKIMQQLRNKHDDLVVHTHSSKAGILGRLAAGSHPGQKVCHTVHGFGFPAFTPATQWVPIQLERMAGARTHHLLFVSEQDQQRAEQLRLAPSAQSHILRAGVDPSAIQQPLDETERFHHLQEMGFNPDDLLVVSVANAKPQKDPLFHVMILAELVKMNPKFKMIFLGDGPLLSDMKQKAQSLGIEKHLFAPGFVSDVRPYLHLSHGFVLASRFEGLPCSVLEALCVGLPTFVRDNGWARDLRQWAQRFFPLAADASAEYFAETIVGEIKGSGTHVPNALPSEFTLAGMLHQLETIYVSSSKPF